MSTTSVLFEHKEYTGHIYAEERTTNKDLKEPEKNKLFQVLRRRIYGTIIDTIKSALLIFVCLLLYKVSGLHAWWIHLVGQII